MAKHMVDVAWRRVSVGAVAIGLLLSGVSACSSFDPVKEKGHKFLVEGDNLDFDMIDTRWHVYDDQHSRNSACTNAVGGAHDSPTCSTLIHPRFTWDGTKCPQLEDNVEDNLKESEKLVEFEPDGSVCLVGVISPVLSCVHMTPGSESPPAPSPGCSNSGPGDLSNMWGAGVGLQFNHDKTAWSPTGHRIGRVTGVAFDLKTPKEEPNLALKVELPIVLDGSTKVPSSRPLMMDNGSVIGLDGKLYVCNDPTRGTALEVEGKALGLAEVVLGNLVVTSGVVTSEQHPLGHPFWQAPVPGPGGKWTSPVKPGHNEFVWNDVNKPPVTDEGNYEFDKDQLLGIEFHVVHPDGKENLSIPFDFCIENLAFLLDE